jgi:phosphoribosylformylglycinamidine synthase II
VASFAATRIGYLTPVVEQPLHRALGLTDGELERIRELLGRDPNDFELAVFSLLWSEHCAYKHSARLLRRLPSSGPRVLQGPGENAGVIDLGEGEAVAFKVESHNHPSAVEPFQGAATGVGGIIRDIVAMGARPVALLDGLRFGEPDWHFERAVEGIGHYGNCLAGEERIVYRNSGRVCETSIAELAEARGGQGNEWTQPPSKPFQVLSFDPDTNAASWRDVKTVFKRTASELIRIKLALGRTLTVTPDHPVTIWRSGGLTHKPAARVEVGDRLPLVASLPRAEPAGDIDLIDEVADPDTVVRFPDHWEPSAELRSALCSVMPRADQRCYRLKRRELPISAFLKVERLVGVERERLRLRLPGPRSTPVPAVFPLTPRTARLIGYYLSEGCCSANGSTFKLIWTFARTRRDIGYVQDLRSILDELEIRHSVEVRESTIAVAVSSRLLGKLFREVLACGSKAHEKRIPSGLMQADPPITQAVLSGIFRGDGSVDYPRRGSAVRVRHSTTSRTLHEQLVLLLQARGIFPYCIHRPGVTEIKGRKVSTRTAHQLEFVGARAIEEAASWFGPELAEDMLNAVRSTKNSPFAHPRARCEGGIATVRVQGTERVPGPAPVYDIEVPGTHLFATTSGVITHNCVGIPTVGGDTVFDDAYRDNCLVNAMCVGLLPADRVTRARARGTGHTVVLFGATTGRDGIGGASVLASQELGEESHEKRPSVQIGDPFTGKKLIETSLELVEKGLVESLQDLGAAGLASSLSEMAREGAGIDVHLDRVPLREEGMEPWEIMISESQERMVAVVRPPLLDRIKEVCDRWELALAEIGSVTDTGELRCYFEGELVGAIPAEYLTEEAPRYAVPQTSRPLAPDVRAPDAPANEEALLRLLRSPNVRSRAWIYRRYDHLVGSRTVRRPGLDAAVLRLRPSLRGLAVSLDGSGRICRLDPRTGGAGGVLEAARNVACAGGEPLAFTDCLNFGNPERGDIGWELAEAIEGIAEACEELGLPIVSGNVSLYNETEGRPIHPTPEVGCVGLVADVRLVPGHWREGDAVFLAGHPAISLAGSEYQALFGEVGGRPAPLELDAEAALIGFLWRSAPLLSLAHDVAEGGLAVCLAEAAIASGIGAELDLPDDRVSLFGEGGGQAVIACAPEEAAALTGVPLTQIGEVRGDTMQGFPVAALREAWDT